MFSNLATTTLGGLGASEMGKVAERFAEWGSDSNMVELLYDSWGNNALSNSALYGIPGMFGVSLQGQVNSPFTDPGEEIQRYMGFVYSNRLKALWNSIGAGVDYYSTTGQSPVKDRMLQMNLARAFAPKMIYRDMQIVGGDLLSASTGSKVVGDLGKAEEIAYKYFNLPSVRIQQGFEISNHIWKDKNKKKELTSKYGKVMADALESSDGTMIQRVMQRALVDGVEMESQIGRAHV